MHSAGERQHEVGVQQVAEVSQVVDCFDRESLGLVEDDQPRDRQQLEKRRDELPQRPSDQVSPAKRDKQLLRERDQRRVVRGLEPCR